MWGSRAASPEKIRIRLTSHPIGVNLDQKYPPG